jgi:hypothetical protein
MYELNYREDNEPESLFEAAMSAAHACGYDRDEKHLLWAEILSIGLASAEDVMPLYPEVLNSIHPKLRDAVVKVLSTG